MKTTDDRRGMRDDSYREYGGPRPPFSNIRTFSVLSALSVVIIMDSGFCGLRLGRPQESVRQRVLVKIRKDRARVLDGTELECVDRLRNGEDVEREMDG